MTPAQKAALKAVEQADALKIVEDFIASQKPTNDGSDMFRDPRTGAMTSRELLRNNANTSPGMAAVSGGMQGTSYRWGDEAIGALGILEGGPEMGKLRKEQARATIEANQEAHPWIYGGSEVAGGVTSSVGLGQAMGYGKAASLSDRTLEGIKIGGIEGLGFGVGQGEGLEGRIQGGIKYGGLGATIGGAAPFAVTGARKAIDGVKAPIAAMRTKPNQLRASQAVLQSVDRSGKSANEITEYLAQAAREGQPEYMLADALGNPGQRQLAGIARTPNDARDEIVAALTNRQNNQSGRLAPMVEDALGVTDTAKATTAALRTSRTEAADLAYNAARGNAAPVDARSAIAAIDDRIGGMQGSDIVGDGIDAKLAKYRARLATPVGKLPEGTTARELSDFDRVLGVKQSVQDDIGAAVRAGRNNEARELGKVMRALDEALEGSSDMYRTANDDFATASGVIDQVDAGAKSNAPRMRSADVVSQYQSLSPDQQAAYRAGRADPMVSRMESAPEGVNKARPLTSAKNQAELGAMAHDPALLQRQIARENTMFETANAAMGGSKTADNLADAAETKAFDVGAIANLLTGNFKTAGVQMGQRAANAMGGRNTATRDLIAKALMSKNVNRAIAPALNSQIRTGSQDQVFEALIRQINRLH